MKAAKKKKSEGWSLIAGPNEPGLHPGESVGDLSLSLGVGRRSAGGRDFEESRRIKFWLWSGSNASDQEKLAQVLLYTWMVSTGRNKRSVIKSVASFVKEVVNGGWISTQELLAEFKQVRKGGRPPGKLSKETQKILASFDGMSQPSNRVLERQVIKQIAAELYPRSHGKMRAKNETKVRRALQRSGRIEGGARFSKTAKK